MHYNPADLCLSNVEEHMKRTFLGGAFAVVVLSMPVVRAADDKTLFYDFPALEQLVAAGLTPAAGGTYEVWIWGKGPELSITIAGKKLSAKAGGFGWQHVGQVQLDGGRRVAVEWTAHKPGDVTNLPGYLALSSDPKFDAKRTPLGALRTLNDGSGFQPASTQEAWQKRRESLVRQVLSSSGLWPMPPKGPLNAQVYGKMARDGYTIEKVVLETFPGFYLSGNLYRPGPWVPVQADADDVKARKEAWKAAREAPKHPGILCPHGHWAYGRFEPEVQKRCKQLARMGAVAFAYDMVGYNDSKPFGHGFLDAQIDLLGFSLLSLQTWNSIRALDFLTSLSDVDLDRVACTGASGGGTQTFILAAIDDRVRVSAPIVMVSQDMQGGCACENAAGLRISSDNSEIAALFAPKPQVLVCAHDWTWEFLTKGFPEVKATYALYGAADQVEAEVYDFPHNYNQTTRERVYQFFSKHLFRIDPKQSRELPLEAEAAETLTTWDAGHPRPATAADPAALKKYLAAMAAQQALRYRPLDKSTWTSVREELASALGYRLALSVPAAGTLVVDAGGTSDGTDYRATHLRLGTRPTPRIAALRLDPAGREPTALTLIVHGNGIAGAMADAAPTATLAHRLVTAGHSVLVIDTYGTGENRSPITTAAPGEIRHFTTYNRSTAAERVQDIATALTYLHGRAGGRPVQLIGVGTAGPLCLLARTQTPFVARTVIDADQFEYSADAAVPAELALPGILRLGGLRSVACLSAPGHMLLHNTGTAFETNWLEEAYRLEAAGKNLTVSRGTASLDQILNAVQ
jgi:dienelactone hydrolase